MRALERQRVAQRALDVVALVQDTQRAGAVQVLGEARVQRREPLRGPVGEVQRDEGWRGVRERRQIDAAPLGFVDDEDVLALGDFGDEDRGDADDYDVLGRRGAQVASDAAIGGCGATGATAIGSR